MASSCLTYLRAVRMRDTDATGRIYFTSQLEMALETFEYFLESEGFPFRRTGGDLFGFPIVHVESDFFKPIEWRDRLELKLEIDRVGNRSFTYTTQIICHNRRSGSVTLTHVTIDTDEVPIAVPEPLRSILMRGKEGKRPKTIGNPSSSPPGSL